MLINWILGHKPQQKHVICTPPSFPTSSLKKMAELITSFKASMSSSSGAIIKFNFRTQKLAFCKGLKGKVINSILTQIRNYTMPQQWTGHDSSIAQFKVLTCQKRKL